MRVMTREEWKDFLSRGTKTGKLATTRRDGRPHVVPIWFVLDGDEIVFTTGKRSVKGWSLRRDGRATLCVDLEEPPYSYVTVEGVAQVSEDPREVRRFAALTGGRYMGADRAEEFGARNGIPGELLVRLRPERVAAFAAITD
jgi:PPOX class probable F420-dependent enzyme